MTEELRTILESESLPAEVTSIDGRKPAFVRVGPVLPVAGHPGWTLDRLADGDLCLFLWRHEDSGAAPVHAHLVNISADPADRRWIKTTSTPNSYPLGARSGYAWTDPGWIESKATTDETAPTLDAWFRERVKLDQADVDVTKDTGSAGVEWWSFVELVAQKHGASPALLGYLTSYAHKQSRRPRHLVDAYARPLSLLPNHVPEKLDEWGTNPVGLNMGDLQHLDGLELAVAYDLTGSPFFLWHLSLLWSTFWKNAGYLAEKDSGKYAYGGSSRTVGWWLALSARMFKAWSAVPQTRFLAEHLVLPSMRWHAKNAIERHPIASPWFYGTPPPGYKAGEVDYVFPWQSSIVAWGLQEVARAVENDDPSLAIEASAGAETIMRGFVENDFDKLTGRVVYVRPAPYAHAGNESLVAWHDPTGVGYYNLPPLIRLAGVDEPGFGLPAAKLFTDLQMTGWTNPESPQYPRAVSYAAPAMGFDGAGM